MAPRTEGACAAADDEDLVVVEREVRGGIPVFWYLSADRRDARAEEGQVYAPLERRGDAALEAEVERLLQAVQPRRARLLESLRRHEAVLRERDGVWVQPLPTQRQAACVLGWARALGEHLCRAADLPAPRTWCEVDPVWRPDDPLKFGLCLIRTGAIFLRLRFPGSSRFVTLPALCEVLCHEVAHLRAPHHDAEHACVDALLHFVARRWLMARRASWPRPFRRPAGPLLRQGRFAVRRTPSWRLSLARLETCAQLAAGIGARLGRPAPERWTELESHPISVLPGCADGFRAFLPAPGRAWVRAHGDGFQILADGAVVPSASPWTASFLLELALQVVSEPAVLEGTPEFHRLHGQLAADMQDDLRRAEEQLATAAAAEQARQRRPGQRRVGA